MTAPILFSQAVRGASVTAPTEARSEALQQVKLNATLAWLSAVCIPTGGLLRNMTPQGREISDPTGENSKWMGISQSHVILELEEKLLA